MSSGETGPPAELVIESELFGGRREFVQGAGGNLSAKTSEDIWIKASGTRLGDAASRPVYLRLPLERVRAAVLETEDLSSYAMDLDGVTLRPSIETALHTLLPYRYVTHLHSTGAIARAVTTGAGSAVSELPIDAERVFVPYAKPGIALAHALLDAVGSPDVHSPKGLVALLGNHGLLVADDDLQRLVDRVFAVSGHWPCTPIVAGPESQRGWIRIAPPGWIGDSGSAALLSGVLTPDEAVFLGPRPWAEMADADSPARARVAPDGSAWIAEELGDDAAQIARSFAEIARAIPAGERVAPLSPGEVADLIDWEAEKWRKAMER